ncbi:MAG: HAD-IIB family hydrolase [Deinococcales bacterium]
MVDDRRSAAEAPAPPLVLFTDLDGTLLDAQYRAGPAAGAVARLQHAGVWVVFCSSKTRAEQEPLRRTLGVSGPFIVENGSAVLVPPPCDDLPQAEGWGRHLLGVPAERVRAGLREVRGRLGLRFQGFAEMRVEAVAEVTGLSLEEARRARQREFSETLVGLARSDAARLQEGLRAEGLQLASGGRFHTVTGLGADKGRALTWLMAWARRRSRAPALASVAVGDSANDAPMLRAADRAFVVARSDGREPQLEGVERLGAIGPAGFAALARRLLAELGSEGTVDLRR